MTVTDEDLAQLIEIVGEAAAAIVVGDMDRYTALIRHAEDYTLMAPNGGVTRRGFDGSPAALAAMAEFFGGAGEAQLEVVETYASGDLAVLVAVERQHGVFGGLPEQDWSLRITLVFRHVGTGWQMVHRHADPLVHAITYDQLAALARGTDPGAS